MKYESLGPVSNPDGSPPELTKQMLAGTGRDPVEFADGPHVAGHDRIERCHRAESTMDCPRNHDWSARGHAYHYRVL